MAKSKPASNCPKIEEKIFLIRIMAHSALHAYSKWYFKWTTSGILAEFSKLYDLPHKLCA